MCLLFFQHIVLHYYIAWDYEPMQVFTAVYIVMFVTLFEMIYRQTIFFRLVGWWQALFLCLWSLEQKLYKEATLPKKHHKNVVWKTSEDYKDTKEKFEMIETFPRLLNELKTNISMLTWRG